MREVKSVYTYILLYKSGLYAGGGLGIYEQTVVFG